MDIYSPLKYNSDDIKTRERYAKCNNSVIIPEDDVALIMSGSTFEVYSTIKCDNCSKCKNGGRDIDCEIKCHFNKEKKLIIETHEHTRFHVHEQYGLCESYVQNINDINNCHLKCIKSNDRIFLRNNLKMVELLFEDINSDDSDTN